MSWDGSVSVVTGYGLNDWSSISSRGRDFYLHHCVQTTSGFHLVFCLVD